MRILLDTCTFLWIITDDAGLSEAARAQYANPENEIVLSAVSGWEIAIKYSLNRLILPEPPDAYIPLQREKHRISFLPLEEEAVLHTIHLPIHHRDPFDRILVSQAIVHGMVILSPDKALHQYPARVMW
jgi:PIN domain nuclease of toxin-antitoxin system